MAWFTIGWFNPVTKWTPQMKQYSAAQTHTHAQQNDLNNCPIANWHKTIRNIPIRFEVAAGATFSYESK